MPYDRSQVTDWINNAQPTDLVTVGKQLLAKISNLPPEQRDQFTREVTNDPAMAKLFTAHA
jgi:hypothetical protein